MIEIENKLKTLAKIAQTFNREKITWAVGASLLLYLKKRINDFHDIDIMVIEDDIKKTDNILSNLGVKLPIDTSVKYKTKYFYEYVIDGVDVDVLSKMIIIKDEKEYDCSLKQESIKENVIINGQNIPLQSLTDWEKYYYLMGRIEKSNMCK